MPIVSGSVVTAPDPVIHFIWKGTKPNPDPDKFKVDGPGTGGPRLLTGWKLDGSPKSLHGGKQWSVRLVPTDHADRSWLLPSTIVSITPDDPPRARFQAVVPGPDGLRSAFDSLVGFPLITETASGSGGSGGPAAGGQVVVDMAFQRGLGRKPSRDDVRGMLALMDGAMEEVVVDGIARWRMRAPGAMITQTDGGAGITGRQFSLANLAQSTAEAVVPLAEAVKPVVEPTGNPSLLEVDRDTFLASLREAVAEASAPGGPMKPKAEVLLNQAIAALGAFGQQLGMVNEVASTFVLHRDNVVLDADEERFTKFLVIVDRYVVFDDFFRAFLGDTPVAKGTFDTSCGQEEDLGLRFTQLDQRLDVVAEAVDELTDALRSVGIDRHELETLRVDPNDPKLGTVADLLDWAHRFASREARPLVQGGGQRGARLLSRRLRGLRKAVKALRATTAAQGPSSGLGHPRVRIAVEKLATELGNARDAAKTFKN
jgi:hypothetical protein